MVLTVVTIMLMTVGERKDRYEHVTEQVERVVSSSIVSHSESLCKLLRYLAEHASDYPKTQVKEYQIATEVFQRPLDFDPRLDSTVRVQTGRLRAKLGEYYAGPGSQDQWVIEIPKGSYALTFHERPASAEPPARPVVPAADAPPQRSGPAPARSLAPVIWALVLVSAGLAVALTVTLFREKTGPVANRQLAGNSQASGAAPVLRRFWSSFIDGADPALLVFSNAEFIGRPETGMRYFDPARDNREGIMDHYTGVGEVAAVHELDRVFFQLGQRLRVKRGRLLSFDDAKQNDIIFVGSPSENLSLRELPNLREFVFRRVEIPERKGDLSIVNLNPRPGEASEFLSSPNPLTEDYAVVGLMPGMGAGHHVLILAGITTIGTQAAVEFVCRPSQLEDLFRRLPAGNGSAAPSAFEAVIRVKISAGVPVSAELAALHARRD